MSGRVNKNRAMVLSGEVRAGVQILEEHDESRRRLVRVARAIGPSSAAALPPLYDVQLLASVGGSWSLAGYERLPVDPIGEECSFGQTWVMSPAPDDDLLRAEREVNRLARLLHQAGIEARPAA